MIKKYFPFFFLIYSSVAYSQSPVFNWGKSIGGSIDEEMRDIVIIDTSLAPCTICPLRLVGTTASDDGNLSSCGSIANDYDAMVIKTNSDGTGYSCEAYGGTAYDEFNTGVFHKSGSNMYQYIYLGQTSSNDGDVSGNHGMSDAWLVRVQFNTIVHQKCIGGNNKDAGFDFIEMPDKGFIICGASASDIIDSDTMDYHGFDDGWITRVDSMGNIIWSKLFGGNLSDYLVSIDKTEDGDFVCAGYSNSNDSAFSNNHGGLDFWVVKFDSLGNLLWQKIYGGSGNEEAHTIVASENNSMMIMGYNSSSDGDITGHHGQSFNQDLWIVKLDSSGNLIWERSYGSTDFQVGYAMCKTNDGNFVVTGGGNGNDGDLLGVPGFSSTWIFKIDTSGTILWSGRFGSNGSEGKQYSVKTYDSKTFYFITHPLTSGGNVTTFYGGFDDVWLGSITDTSQALEVNQITQYHWGSVFPNPVQDKLNLTLYDPKPTLIQLCDALGNILHTFKTDGKYLTIDLGEYPAGFYLLKILQNNKVYIQRIIKTP